MLKAVSSITNALGALNYKGTWNASTNNPTLADGTGEKGDYYVVSTAGTQTFGGVQLFFGTGDWIAYNGAVWQRVEGGSDGNFANVTLTSTDAGAAASPLLELYRDSATPAASDTLGEIEFNGEDSAGNKQAYGLIHASILSPTSTAEQGQLHFETATAGVLTEKMIIGTNNLVINEIGAVFNVRIEGDTDANLLYTDATNDRVGVGTVTPTVKLDVAGTIAGTQLNIDNLRLDGNTISSQDTNGVINLLPNGTTGDVRATTRLRFQSNAQNSDGALASYRVSLSTVATDISAYDGTWGHLAIVTGLSTVGGNFFTDLVFSSATAGPTVLSAKVVSGAPAARTYSMSGSSKLQLAMSSDTYDVRSAILYGLQ